MLYQMSDEHRCILVQHVALMMNIFLMFERLYELNGQNLMHSSNLSVTPPTATFTFDLLAPKCNRFIFVPRYTLALATFGENPLMHVTDITETTTRINV